MLLKLPKKKKKKKKTCDKKPEFEIKATSSKELSDIKDSHSTDDANSTVTDVYPTSAFWVLRLILTKAAFGVERLANQRLHLGRDEVSG
ncbi:hypothetical protein TNCV_4078421 [Trichonephila clavipes]|nr:hypothetical protein TNCV_4078421 [Trichonephila clavipes]